MSVMLKRGCWVAVAAGLLFSHFALANYCTMADKIYGCDFEVFGIVQGVFFRKYTEKQAKSLGLKGWCMNTAGGTVKGQLEGPLPKINDMKKWLETTGSPSSRIDKAVFSDSKELPNYTYKDFTIKR